MKGSFLDILRLLCRKCNKEFKKDFLIHARATASTPSEQQYPTRVITVNSVGQDTYITWTKWRNLRETRMSHWRQFAFSSHGGFHYARRKSGTYTFVCQRSSYFQKTLLQGAFIIYLEGGLWWFPKFFLSFFESPPIFSRVFFFWPPPKRCRFIKGKYHSHPPPPST